MLLLNECLLLLFISLSTESGNFWIHPRTIYEFQGHNECIRNVADNRSHPCASNYRTNLPSNEPGQANVSQFASQKCSNVETKC
jgi:hypothetical protein